MLAFSRTSLLVFGLLPLLHVLPSFAHAHEQQLESKSGSVAVVARTASACQGTPAQVEERAENVDLFSLARYGFDSTAGATNGRKLRPSPTAVKPDLPLFVIQSPSQVLVTAGYSSGLMRTATAGADAAFNPQHDPATSGVVSFVCKSLGLFVTLIVTAVVVFLASGPGL